jgi:hypothetical protein
MYCFNCFNSVIDYAKLQAYQKEIDKKEEENEKNNYTLLYQIIIVLTVLTMLIKLEPIINVYIGTLVSMITFMIKFIISKKKKEKNYFLPEPEKNYVEIPYKIKSQAIDAKVTCHSECNPIKYMRDESNRIYIIYNSSDSLDKYLK